MVALRSNRGGIRVNQKRRVLDMFMRAEDVPENEITDFLDQECGQDVELRQKVEKLLSARNGPKNFLPDKTIPSPIDDAELRNSSDEELGKSIGPYKLQQKIGEGGFGVVFMATQSQPVRRQVALKIIKPGMDSRQVIARFESERQALAMMDHPNIARVFDAGQTENDRPYFVMELVKGVPITEFCDKNNFDTTERLELFMTVCHAVQHAHQKGVIHRDLKPANIMVKLDSVPVVKVIDFGVSKAITQRLTEKTLFTQLGQMIGTPQYMGRSGAFDRADK